MLNFCSLTGFVFLLISVAEHFVQAVPANMEKIAEANGERIGNTEILVPLIKYWALNNGREAIQEKFETTISTKARQVSEAPPFEKKTLSLRHVQDMISTLQPGKATPLIKSADEKFEVDSSTWYQPLSKCWREVNFFRKIRAFMLIRRAIASTENVAEATNAKGGSTWAVTITMGIVVISGMITTVTVALQLYQLFRENDFENNPVEQEIQAPIPFATLVLDHDKINYSKSKK